MASGYLPYVSPLLIDSSQVANVVKGSGYGPEVRCEFSLPFNAEDASGSVVSALSGHCGASSFAKCLK